jgi:hypothetical protein
LRCIFLDTAGHGAPLRNPQTIMQGIEKAQNEEGEHDSTQDYGDRNSTKITGEIKDPRREALLRKKISEDILKELAFEMSDVIIVVLNELSWSDQV